MFEGLGKLRVGDDEYYGSVTAVAIGAPNCLIPFFKITTPGIEEETVILPEQKYVSCKDQDVLAPAGSSYIIAAQEPMVFLASTLCAAMLFVEMSEEDVLYFFKRSHYYKGEIIKVIAPDGTVLLEADNEDI